MPVAWTSLVAWPLASPQPVLCTDDKIHLVYDGGPEGKWTRSEHPGNDPQQMEKFQEMGELPYMQAEQRAACDFIRARSLPGPIYNDIGWGGFIIWSLPDYPVAIDGRTDLYGDAILYRYYREQQGPLDWRSDPYLNAAKLVLLNSQSGLAMRMQEDPHFRVVYDDPIAIVFIRNDAGVLPDAPVSHQ